MSYALDPSLVPHAVRLKQTMQADPAEATTHTIPGGPPSYNEVVAALVKEGHAAANLIPPAALWKALAYNADVREARRTRYDRALNQLVQKAVKELAQVGSWKNDGISWATLCNRLGWRKPPTTITGHPVVQKAFAEAVAAWPMFFSGWDAGLCENRREVIATKAIAALESREWLVGAKPTWLAVIKHLGVDRIHVSRFKETQQMRSALHHAVAEWERETSTVTPAKKEEELETLPKAAPSQRQEDVGPVGPEWNLARFIQEAKATTALKGAVWDSWRWTATDDDSARKKERAHNYRSRLIFANLETSTGKANRHRNRAPMPEPYLSFAKADILIYQQARDVTTAALAQRIQAHRHLEFVFRQHKLLSIEDLTLSHFYEAETIAKEKGCGGAYMLGCNLARIGGVLDGRGLTRCKIQYQTSLKEPRRHDSLTPEGQAEGEKKMMSDSAVEAFAKLSSNPPPDDMALLVIRITDLLVVGGFRIGEALTLPADTLVRDNREIIVNPATGEKAKAVGLKYIPEKVFDYRTKPISPSAVPVVERAINDINRICGPARQVARWMEAHPGRLKPLWHLKPDDIIGGQEVCELLGLHEKAHHFLAGVPKRLIRQLRSYSRLGLACQKRFKVVQYRVGDIERHFLGRLDSRAVMKAPDGRIQSLSDTLVVFPQHGDAWRPTPLSLGGYTNRIQALLPKFRSHQARHRLNTLAEFGGMSDIEQLKLFGRTSIAQNYTYKHGTVAHRKEQMVKLVLGGEVHGSVARIAANLPIEDREAFIRAVIGHVHVTPFGMCIHDYAALPCQEDHACLNECGDYLRVKNDEESRQNILEAQRGALIALEVASRALLDEPWSKEFAEPHIAAAKKKFECCAVALAIDDRPIESPDPIKVFPHAPSRFKALA